MSGPCCVWEICCPPPEVVEALARELHEAGRTAVESGLVVNKVPGQPFFSWDELKPEAQEGRRVMAHQLLGKHRLIPRGLNDDPVFRETLDREIRTHLKNQGIPTEKEA